MPTHLVDLKNTTVLGTSLVSAAARSASANGTGVDLLTADGTCFVLVHTGAVTGSPTTLNYKVEESDDNSTFTAIANQSTDGTSGDHTGGNLVEILNLKHRAKRYIRVVATLAGGSSPTYLGVAFVIGRKKIAGTAGGSQL